MRASRRNYEWIPTAEVSMSNIDEEMVLAHFIVSDDVERSRRFYTEVLGGKTVISGEAADEVTYVALANSWIIINVGGGPTDDKPTVTLETQPDRDRVSSFLNIRVADIQAVYAEWAAGVVSDRNRGPSNPERSQRGDRPHTHHQLRRLL
jgi:catechol 2,3-dioxygenase-like lactoylglutathione lyase family enzyme